MFIDLSDAGWDEFFPQSCDILELSTTLNDLGEPRETWAPVAGLQNIGAALEFKSGEVKTSDVQRLLSSHTIHLRGHFPGAKAGMRATIDAQSFVILAAGADSQGVKTRLLTQILE